MIWVWPPRFSSVLTLSAPTLTKRRWFSPNGKVTLVIFSNAATAYSPFPILELSSFLAFHAVAAFDHRKVISKARSFR